MLICLSTHPITHRRKESFHRAILFLRVTPLGCEGSKHSTQQHSGCLSWARAQRFWKRNWKTKQNKKNSRTAQYKIPAQCNPLWCRQKSTVTLLIWAEHRNPGQMDGILKCQISQDFSVLPATKSCLFLTLHCKNLRKWSDLHLLSISNSLPKHKHSARKTNNSKFNQNENTK